MSTLSIAATHRPQTWPSSFFSRALTALSTVLDVYVEAQKQARDAQKRYPYASFE
jgi:hypothetical protein